MGYVHFYQLAAYSQKLQVSRSIVVQVKVLIYSLVSSFGSYSCDFTSLTLSPGERTPSDLKWRISECCTFWAPIYLLSVQSGSKRGLSFTNLAFKGIIYIMLRTTRGGGGTVDLLIRGKLGDSCVCVFCERLTFESPPLMSSRHRN